MRIPRFYLPIPLQTGAQRELPAELFRHAIQVLRLQAGEALILFNGEGGEYLARLEQVGKRSASLLIEAFDPVERESGLQLTLVQAIIKPDKMDFALQKAVELGISHFQPLITQRSVVRLGKDKQEKKLQHWQAVVSSACEQCGRTRLPQVLEPLSLEAWLAQPAKPQNPAQHPSVQHKRLILAPGDYPRLSKAGAISSATTPTALEVLIGPEGGFTDEEVAQCLQAGVEPISLGTRILRAETASVTVLALLQHLYGDL